MGAGGRLTGTGASGPGPSRRAVLVAAVVLPVAGCTREPRPVPPPPVDPDVALRAAAVAREQELLALYDLVLAGPGSAGAPSRAVLAGLRAEHATHLAVLVAPAPPATAGPPASPSAAAPAGLPELRAAEAAAASAHAEAVTAASRSLAALLASLSAAESTHAGPLR